jgi:hypothetical protein
MENPPSPAYYVFKLAKVYVLTASHDKTERSITYNDSLEELGQYIVDVEIDIKKVQNAVLEGHEGKNYMPLSKEDFSKLRKIMQRGLEEKLTKKAPSE